MALPEPSSFVGTGPDYNSYIQAGVNAVTQPLAIYNNALNQVDQQRGQQLQLQSIQQRLDLANLLQGGQVTRQDLENTALDQENQLRQRGLGPIPNLDNPSGGIPYNNSGLPANPSTTPPASALFPNPGGPDPSAAVPGTSSGIPFTPPAPQGVGKVSNASAPDANGFHMTLGTTFATPSDLANFAKNKSLATGDNGVGAWGDDTTGNTPYVALPPSTLKAYGIDPNTARGTPVTVTANGKTMQAVVGDKMPDNSSNGAGIDMNPATAAGLGISDVNNFKGQVSFKIGAAPASSASGDDNSQAASLPSPFARPSSGIAVPPITGNSLLASNVTTPASPFSLGTPLISALPPVQPLLKIGPASDQDNLANGIALNTGTSSPFSQPFSIGSPIGASDKFSLGTGTLPTAISRANAFDSSTFASLGNDDPAAGISLSQSTSPLFPSLLPAHTLPMAVARTDNAINLPPVTPVESAPGGQPAPRGILGMTTLPPIGQDTSGIPFSSALTLGTTAANSTNLPTLGSPSMGINTPIGSRTASALPDLTHLAPIGQGSADGAIPVSQDGGALDRAIATAKALPGAINVSPSDQPSTGIAAPLVPAVHPVIASAISTASRTAAASPLASQALVGKALDAHAAMTAPVVRSPAAQGIIDTGYFADPANQAGWTHVDPAQRNLVPPGATFGTHRVIPLAQQAEQMKLDLAQRQFQAAQTAAQNAQPIIVPNADGTVGGAMQAAADPDTPFAPGHVLYPMTVTNIKDGVAEDAANPSLSGALSAAGSHGAKVNEHMTIVGGRPYVDMTSLYSASGADAQSMREQTAQFGQKYLMAQSAADAARAYAANPNAPKNGAGDTQFINSILQTEAPGTVPNADARRQIAEKQGWGDWYETTLNKATTLHDPAYLSDAQRQDLLNAAQGSTQAKANEYLTFAKSNIAGVAQKAVQAANSAAPTPAVLSGTKANPATVNTQADYAALPSGAYYVDSNGKLGQKR